MCALNIKTSLNEFTSLCDSVGLLISHEKTKLMTIRKKEKLVIQGQEIEYVNAYKYVGVMLNANTSNSKEIASLGQKWHL